MRVPALLLLALALAGCAAPGDTPSGVAPLALESGPDGLAHVAPDGHSFAAHVPTVAGASTTTTSFVRLVNRADHPVAAFLTPISLRGPGVMRLAWHDASGLDAGTLEMRVGADALALTVPAGGSLVGDLTTEAPEDATGQASEFTLQLDAGV